MIIPHLSLPWAWFLNVVRARALAVAGWIGGPSRSSDLGQSVPGARCCRYTNGPWQSRHDSNVGPRLQRPVCLTAGPRDYARRITALVLILAVGAEALDAVASARAGLAEQEVERLHIDLVPAPATAVPIDLATPIRSTAQDVEIAVALACEVAQYRTAQRITPVAICRVMRMTSHEGDISPCNDHRCRHVPHPCRSRR